MSDSLLDAFEAGLRAAHYEDALRQAQSELADQSDLERERAWLDEALERLHAAASDWAALSEDALAHEALTPAREAQARKTQLELIEGTRSLVEQVVEVGGENGPLEAVIRRKLEIPNPRRMTPEGFVAFVEELERRLGSTYLARMIAEPPHDALDAPISALKGRIERWRRLEHPEPLEADAAEALASRLRRHARALERPLRQAELLALAAAIDDEVLTQRLTLTASKAKRRAKK